MRMDDRTACISFRYVIKHPKIREISRHFHSLRLINSTLGDLYLENHLNIDNHLLIFDRKLIRIYQNTQIILSSL